MSPIDERFLKHRLRSTSIAGMAGAALAGGLWFYRFLVDDRLEWDLFAVLATIAVVKIALMIRYHFTD
jgi:hypothetical protein